MLCYVMFVFHLNVIVCHCDHHVTVTLIIISLSLIGMSLFVTVCHCDNNDKSVTMIIMSLFVIMLLGSSVITMSLCGIHFITFLRFTLVLGA